MNKCMCIPFDLNLVHRNKIVKLLLSNKLKFEIIPVNAGHENTDY